MTDGALIATLLYLLGAVQAWVGTWIAWQHAPQLQGPMRVDRSAARLTTHLVTVFWPIVTLWVVCYVVTGSES